MKFKKVETRIRKSSSSNYCYPEYRTVWLYLFRSEWNCIYYFEGIIVEKMCSSLKEAQLVIDSFIARGYTPISNEDNIINYP